MLRYLIQGFVLGLSYVAPIGMQNLYVINTALVMSKKRAFEVAFITIFFDITLSVASFFGIGVLMDKVYFLKLSIFLLGTIVIFYIGVTLIRSKPKLSNNKVDMNISLCKAVVGCFTVTWFNPQAIIDGSLLLGSFRAAMPLYASKFFVIGMCTASFIWFIFLAAVFSRFKNIFNENVLRKINIVCGSVVLFYGVKLGYNFFKLIF
ncbi:LysE/ArgO family amino acid transporter [Clostridium sp. WILCCON 0269]|uniref:LysE/ArgO family amino acid transporter n=1 Tax=Candidatus Clostridium eludens TaxID=3381663 RepID=A0ABW8SNB7_9CLOT